MGKNDFLTPKQIGNRIKAKGLQKLRWYCQMCGKQCRDENGFKCHLTSDSHRRQMEVFGQNPDRVIDGYSEEFHRSFIEHLRMAHPNVRIEAHKVYNEYIQDKHHVHMNSTKWLTLTEYVKYLGKEGICTVEDTEKGWFIRLVQRDAAQEELEAEMKKQRRRDLADARRGERQIEAQLARAREVEARSAAAAPAAQPAEESAVAPRMAIDERTQPLQLSMADAASEAQERPRESQRTGTGRAMFDALAGPSKRAAESVPDSSGRKRSKVEEMMQLEKEKKARMAAAEASHATASAGTLSGPWVMPGIVVKVMAKALGEYYKCKGTIQAVRDEYLAEVEMLDSGDVLRVDQAELETVVPKSGGKVKILLGRYKGETAVVQEVLKDEFVARLALSSGKEVLEEYEHFSKLAS